MVEHGAGKKQFNFNLNVAYISQKKRRNKITQ